MTSPHVPTGVCGMYSEMLSFSFGPHLSGLFLGLLECNSKIITSQSNCTAAELQKPYSNPPDLKKERKESHH